MHVEMLCLLKSSNLYCGTCMCLWQTAVAYWPLCVRCACRDTLDFTSQSTVCRVCAYAFGSCILNAWDRKHIYCIRHPRQSRYRDRQDRKWRLWFKEIYCSRRHLGARISGCFSRARKRRTCYFQLWFPVPIKSRERSGIHPQYMHIHIQH